MVRLAGKVAVVTGGGSGIGAAIARRFAAEGAAVVVTGRRRAPLDTIAGELGGVSVPGDIADPDHPSEIVARATAAFGGVDVVVANAGIDLPASAAEVTDADWQHTLDVNLTGPMRLCRVVVPSMLARGGGSLRAGSSSPPTRPRSSPAPPSSPTAAGGRSRSPAPPSDHRRRSRAQVPRPTRKPGPRVGG